MKNYFLTVLLLAFASIGFAQDPPLTEQEKSELLSKSPFNVIYPTSILKSADKYFESQMGLYTQGVINEKDAHLIALGTAAATKCDYCVPYHVTEARRLGATEEEIKTAILIAADIMRMSTLFYGNEYDLDAFKKMLRGPMSVLVVNYELKDISLDDHAKLGAQVAPMFTSENVHGLIGKTFIGDTDDGVYGGVYYFTDQASMNAYLNSDLWKGIVAHPNLVNFTTEVYSVAPISEVTNGIASARKTSSNGDDAKDIRVLIVNYELENMTLEEHAELGSKVGSNFSPENIDGLIGKTFIGNTNDGVFGGVYYFTDEDSMNAYLESDLWNGIVAHPNLVNFTTETYGVASISAISNGVPVK